MYLLIYLIYRFLITIDLEYNALGGGMEIEAASRENPMRPVPTILRTCDLKSEDYIAGDLHRNSTHGAGNHNCFLMGG